MTRHALLLALPLLLVGCPEKEVDDLIDEEEDDDDDGGGTISGDCPEQDLGSAIGRAVAEGQITRQSTRYRYCGGSGGYDSGGSDGWGSGSGSGGGGWDSFGGPPPPDSPDGGGNPGVSFQWTAPSDGTFVFDTCGSRYDTTLGIRGSDCEGDTLECNDDWYGLKSRVQVNADEGDTFVVVVSGFSGDVGAYTLSIGQGDAAGDCQEDSGWYDTTSTWYGTDTGYYSEIPEVGVEWTSSGVELYVYGGAGAYWFGMAQTDGCEDCWTGEDCVYGYEADGASLLYCHDAGDWGTSLTYGGDRTALAAGTTAFVDGTVAAGVTYFLESDVSFGGDGSCYVWGADPSYYDGLGCTQF
jgi:hypothetical protein